LLGLISEASSKKKKSRLLTQLRVATLDSLIYAETRATGSAYVYV
jgi:hypothetical protein